MAVPSCQVTVPATLPIGAREAEAEAEAADELEKRQGLAGLLPGLGLLAGSQITGACNCLSLAPRTVTARITPPVSVRITMRVIVSLNTSTDHSISTCSLSLSPAASSQSVPLLRRHCYDGVEEQAKMAEWALVDLAQRRMEEPCGEVLHFHRRPAAILSLQ